MLCSKISCRRNEEHKRATLSNRHSFLTEFVTDWLIWNSATEFKYKLRGFVAERKGERDDMQDAHVISDDFLEEFDTKPAEM